TPSIRTDHKALLSIRDYIDRNGTLEGKRLLEHFTSAPFGWSPDTLRYLVAAFLVAGEIKLKVAGREVTVAGQQAIDALKSNNTFKPIGIALRDERPSLEVCAKAATRLTELLGDIVPPLEGDISKAVTKNFPHIQLQLAPLEGKLVNLDLPGADNIRSLNKDIADILFTDASDAPQRLGGEESSLYENLKWAREVDTAFKNGLEETVRSLQQHRHQIEELPNSGVPGELKEELAEELSLLKDRLGKRDFYKHAPDLNSMLTNFKGRTRDTVVKMHGVQKNSIKEMEQDLHHIPEWGELTQEEQRSVLKQIEELQVVTSEDLQGLKKLISQEFVIHSTLQDLRKRIVSMGRERAQEKERERREKAKKENVYFETVSIPKSVKSLKDLNDLLQALEKLRARALEHDKVEISFTLNLPEN
ncbi:MAG: BREX system P-loop protein BrxC, partial [Spirochaetota bacterium]